MKRLALCFFLLLFVLPFLCHAETTYKVVIKKTGKVIEGKLLGEDAESIHVLVNGLQVGYKKDQLDLEKMKVLNSQKEKELNLRQGGVTSELQTQHRESATEAATRLKAEKAKQQAATSPGQLSADPDTAALQKRISQLQQEIDTHNAQIKKDAEAGKDITTLTKSVSDLQTELDAAKKELADKTHSTGKNVDAQIAELNQNIADTQKELDQAIHDGQSTNTVTKLRVKLEKYKKDLAALQKTP